MILKVHRSNFFMSGFVESPSSDEISELARRKRIPFVEDLGSGAVAATEEFGIDHHEPTPAEVLKSGVDLVSFSGDKLFGGPQAGIIAGKKKFVTALKREPVFRALRCDKLCLAALQATVDLHLNQRHGVIPTLALLQVSEDELRARAASICNQLSGQSCNLQVAVASSVAKVGGGTLPRSKMPSVTIEIVPGNCSPLEFASRLRADHKTLVFTNGIFDLIHPGHLRCLERAHRTQLAPVRNRLGAASAGLVGLRAPNGDDQSLRVAGDVGDVQCDELGPPQRLLGRIRSELEFLDVPELLTDGLHEMLDHIQSCVREVADAIAFQYFRNLQVEITPVAFTPAAEPVGPD